MSLDWQNDLWLRKLPVLDNYFEGCRAPGCCYLDNLLLFSILDPADLNRQAWKAHWHHRYVLIIPWKGEGTVVVDRSPRTIGPGQAILIFPYQLHYYQVEPTNSLSWLYLTFECSNGHLLDPLREHVLAMTRENQHRLEAILQAYVEFPVTAKTAVTLVLQTGLLVQKLSPVQPAPQMRLGEIDPWLDRVQTAVVRAFPDPPGQVELAQQVGLSHTHLRRQFLAKTGLTLGSYMRSLRLQLICNQLARREVNLTEIADVCGFSSLAAFSQFFLRQTGMSPSVYRAQQNGGGARGSSTRVGTQGKTDSILEPAAGQSAPPDLPTHLL